MKKVAKQTSQTKCGILTARTETGSKTAMRRETIISIITTALVRGGGRGD